MNGFNWCLRGVWLSMRTKSLVVVRDGAMAAKNHYCIIEVRVVTVTVRNRRLCLRGVFARARPPHALLRVCCWRVSSARKLVASPMISWMWLRLAIVI